MTGIVGQKGISIGGSGGSCDDATVEINGVEFDTVASGGTIDIPVLQDGAPVGSIVDGEVILCVVEMGLNDFLEVHVANGSVANVTVEQMNFVITEIK
jgi:hypothetical protein